MSGTSLVCNTLKNKYNAVHLTKKMLCKQNIVSLSIFGKITKDCSFKVKAMI